MKKFIIGFYVFFFLFIVVFYVVLRWQGHLSETQKKEEEKHRVLFGLEKDLFLCQQSLSSCEELSKMADENVSCALKVMNAWRDLARECIGMDAGQPDKEDYIKQTEQ